MQPDVLVLGVVKSIHQFHIELCLPQGELGRAHISDISEKYTEILKESVETGKLNEGVVGLDTLFCVGHKVRGIIKGADKSGSSGHKHIKNIYSVSLDPKEVNKAVFYKHIRPGCIYVGCVISCEDHGFMLDAGVANVHFFLPKDCVTKTLYLGDLACFTPTVEDLLDFAASGTKRVLKVSLCDLCGLVLNDTPGINFGCFLPGLCVRASVVKKISSTIVVRFQDYMISINRAHYPGSEEEYRIGMDLTVCLIMVDPSTKQLVGSLLPHLVPLTGGSSIPRACTKIAIGTRVESIVERVDKRTVHLKLPGTYGVQAVVRKAHIPNKHIENLKSKYTVNSKVTCRIIDYDLLENVAIGTMKKKLLEASYLSIGEVKPGDQVVATIIRFTKTGVVVRIEDRLSGLIPYMHLSDVILKQPQEKFKRGDKLNCRVLVASAQENKLLLTAKRSLVEASLPLFGSSEMQSQLEVRKTLENQSQLIVLGFVVKISEQGILISGLDNIRGWVPKSKTGLSDADVLQANYFRGQVLRLRVIRELKGRKLNQSGDSHDNDDSVHASLQSKYLLSLKIQSSSEQPNTKPHHPTTSTSLSIGHLYYASLHKLQDSGLLVNLHSKEVNSSDEAENPSLGIAFLPFIQLSDFESNSNLLSKYVRNAKSNSPLNFDETCKQVVLINKTTNTLIVSAKSSLINASKLQIADDHSSEQSPTHTGFVRCFEDLRVGTQWLAWVGNHTDYGVFVQFPAGIRGLAPTRLLSEQRLSPHATTNWSEFLPPGSTVIAKVVELASSDKRRCLVSLRMIDTYNASEVYIGTTLPSVESWLAQRQWISRKHEFLSAFHIGDRINFRVRDLDNEKVLGEAHKLYASINAIKSPVWVPALAYLINTENVKCLNSAIYPGVVSFVDHVTGTLEVVLSTWFINAVSNRKENAATELRPGQQVLSTVLAFRPRDIVIIALKGHANGRIGVIPAKRSFNEFTGGNSWAIGQRNKVTLRQSFVQSSNTQTLQLCTLTTYDPIDPSALRQLGWNPPKVSTDHSKSSVTHDGTVQNLNSKSQITGLRFQKLCGQTLFLSLNLDVHRTVFCHLINFDESAKKIRSFVANPPPENTLIERQAFILHSATEDKRISTHGRGSLHSKLAEVSFVETEHVVGNMVCAQLLHNKGDHWTLRLANGAKGILHMTGLTCPKQPQPLDLDSCTNSRGITNVQSYMNRMKQNGFINCRIIDQSSIKRPCTNLDEFDSKSVKPKEITETVWFVTGQPHVLRGGLAVWKKRAPQLETEIDGFVKIRCPHGLVLSVTHSEDIWVPFTSNLYKRLTSARIRFRVGDHLLAIPIRYKDTYLIGQLALSCTDSQILNSEFDQESALFEALGQLISEAKDKTQSAQRRLDELRKQKLESSIISSNLQISNTDSSTTEKVRRRKSSFSEFDSIRECPSEKKIRLDESPPDQLETDQAMFDRELFTRYKDFMPPEKSEIHSEQVKDSEQATRSASSNMVNNDLSTQKGAVPVTLTEWQLREAEIRKAMLAALTIEQQCLPKGNLRPQTTEEFEMAIRNAPTNAACWTAYMTHLLSGNVKNSGIVEARALAERGLRAMTSCAGSNQNETDAQQAALLTFYLIMEAKQLERCTELQHYHGLGTDPVLETNEQANRLSDVLSRLVNLDQAPYIRRAIDTLTEIGQHDRAEELARRLVKSSPMDIERWLSLIKVRFRAGRIAAAREAQKNAATLIRTSQIPQFSVGVARIEFEYGDADRGINLLREQLAAHPKCKQLYHECINLLLVTGRNAEAKSILQHAQEALKPKVYESIAALVEKVA